MSYAKEDLLRRMEEEGRIQDLAEYQGPGCSALPTLAAFVAKQGQVTLAEATQFVCDNTGLSDVTVWKAWLVLLDLDALVPWDATPRPGRHRGLHRWVYTREPGPRC